jgi:Pyruvate/2-oxoacid:ferredoxin oxidoreductase delta subunit
VSVTNYLHSILPAKQAQILQSHSKSRGSQMLTRYDELNLNYFEVRPREKIRKLDILERLSAFGEVNLGLIENSAQNEAARCFHCGVCNQCDNCYVYCPDIAVSKNEPEEGGYTIDMNYCKGCGICVYECPRSAMVMEKER